MRKMRRVRVNVRSPRMAARRLNSGYHSQRMPVLKGEPSVASSGYVATRAVISAVVASLKKYVCR